MRFATERLSVASVSKPNSLLTPLSSLDGLILCKWKNPKFKPGRYRNYSF
ncbi:MAG: hypothetical protein OXB86_01035 [Bdellovibrionales bacterium]|nr:hypothetical protein [Bdellovibrionales bacterium]